MAEEINKHRSEKLGIIFWNVFSEKVKLVLLI